MATLNQKIFRDTGFSIGCPFWYRLVVSPGQNSSLFDAGWSSHPEKFLEMLKGGGAWEEAMKKIHMFLNFTVKPYSKFLWRSKENV